jgi:2-(1,2-epoxy-1,2-dihydrophenyl)acetyl-CoA isomerase
VLREKHGPVAVIRLNRPDRLNAVNAQMIAELREAIALADAADIRSVVFLGNGPCLMAGADLTLFRDCLERASETAADLIDGFHAMLRAIRAIRKPVIVAASGNIAGGGLGFILACDVVVMAENATLLSGYSKLGTSPDAGTTWSLTRAVGARRAFELMCLNEPMAAAEALALDLVNRVVPSARLEEETLTLGRRLAEGAPLAMAHIKGLVETAGILDLESQLDRERAAFVECAATADFREGVTAFFGKRPPRFKSEPLS